MIIEKTIELIALISLTALFTYLIIYNVMLRYAAKKATAQVVQAKIDKLALYGKIDELQKEAKLSTQGSDGFLKFVSQSRDWAFGYIEEAQRAIKDFQLVATPVLYKKSGDPELKEVISAYEKLLKMLPEESEEQSS
jgi:hypothetical protein